MMFAQQEAMVIGSVLNDNDLMTLAEHLKPEHFHFGFNRAIWKSCIEVFDRGQALDIITLGERLKAMDLLEDVGGFVGLNRMTELTTSRANFPLAVDAIIENDSRQAMIRLFAASLERLEADASTQSISTEVQNALEALKPFYKEGEISDINSCMLSLVEVLERRMEGKEKKLSTGLTALDKKLGGGLAGGELIILAGRPAMGKTALSLNMALAASNEKPVMFFSLEMPKQQLTERMLSSVSSIPLSWIQNPMNDENWNRVSAGMQRLSALPIFVVDKSAASLSDIRSKTKQVARMHGGVGLIVVDYLTLMGGSSKENRTHEVGEYSRGLKAIAKEFNVPVIALAQLNRGLENRTNKRPMMSDLRDSGEVEQDADIVILLYRDEVYDEQSPDKGVAELIIAKQRQGETGTAYATFRGMYTRFDDLPHEYRRTEPVRPSRNVLPKDF